MTMSAMSSAPAYPAITRLSIYVLASWLRGMTASAPCQRHIKNSVPSETSTRKSCGSGVWYGTVQHHVGGGCVAVAARHEKAEAHHGGQVGDLGQRLGDDELELDRGEQQEELVEQAQVRVVHHLHREVREAEAREQQLRAQWKRKSSTSGTVPRSRTRRAHQSEREVPEEEAEAARDPRCHAHRRVVLRHSIQTRLDQHPLHLNVRMQLPLLRATAGQRFSINASHTLTLYGHNIITTTTRRAHSTR